MSVAEASPKKEEKRRFRLPERFYTMQAWVALVIVFLLAIVLSPNRGGGNVFLRPDNLLNIVRATSEIGIIAIGMTLVILIGGIDLSVGAVLGLAATGTAILLTANGLGVFATVVIVLLIGVVFGTVQGYISARFGLQAFIVTLAGMQVARGLARIWSGGQGVPIAYGEGPGVAPPVFSLLNERLFGVIPYPAIIFLIVAVIALFAMNKSVFARQVYAIGGNEKAARLSGVPVIRVKVAVFTISATLAALAGIIHAGQLNQGSPNDGIAYEMDAIAAVVIGGTSLAGGIGGVSGTIAGAILLGVLNNILALNNVDSNLQLIIKGIIIVAAAMLQSFRSDRS